MSEIVPETFTQMRRTVAPFWGVILAMIALTLLYIILFKFYLPVFTIEDWAARTLTIARRSHALRVALLGVAAALILLIEGIHVARWEWMQRDTDAKPIFAYFAGKPRRNLLSLVVVIAWSSQTLFYISSFRDYIGLWENVYSVTSIKLYAGWLIVTPVRMLIPGDSLVAVFLIDTLAGMLHWFLLLLPVAVLADRGYYRSANFAFLAVLLGHIAWGVFFPQPMRMI